jgi:hypothetical protein
MNSSRRGKRVLLAKIIDQDTKNLLKSGDHKNNSNDKYNGYRCNFCKLLEAIESKKILYENKVDLSIPRESLLNLVANEREYQENSRGIEEEINAHLFDEMEFSKYSKEVDILKDTGMHITRNPGFSRSQQDY